MDTGTENAVATAADAVEGGAVIDGAAADIAVTVARNAPSPEATTATEPPTEAVTEPAAGGPVRDGRGRFVPRPGSRPRRPRPAATEPAGVVVGRSTVIDPGTANTTADGGAGGAVGGAVDDGGQEGGQGGEGGQELVPEAAEVLADRTFDLAESLVGEQARPTDGERSAVKSAANKCLGGMRIPWWAALALPLSFWGLRVLVVWNKDRKEKRAKDGNAHGDRRDDGIGQKPMGKGPVCLYE